MISVHASKLERYLGRDQVEDFSRRFRDWPGPPVPIANVPGKVYVAGGGDFVGHINGGLFTSFADIAEQRIRQIAKAMRQASRDAARIMGTGPTSMDAIIAAASNPGRKRRLTYSKGDIVVVTGTWSSLFYVPGTPAAGAIAAAAPGGTVLDKTTTGAFPFDNPTGGRVQNLTSGMFGVPGSANYGVMLIDRLGSVAKTMASTATEAVSQTLTRYQSTTPGDEDFAGGNFVMPECVTALPATAHNWNVCQYTDQSGNTGASFPSIAGISSCAANRLDMAQPNFFMPMASGDTGVLTLTQMQCSASVASGSIAFTVAHPIAVFPSSPSNSLILLDFINSSFSLERIFDDACLSFLGFAQSNTTLKVVGDFITIET